MTQPGRFYCPRHLVEKLLILTRYRMNRMVITRP